SLDRRLALLRLRGALGFGEHTICLGADLGALPLDLPPEQEIGNDRERGQRDRNREVFIHFRLPPFPRDAEVQSRLHDDAEECLPPSVRTDRNRGSQITHSLPSCPLVLGAPTPSFHAPRASSSFRIRRSARATALVGSSFRCFEA